MATSASTRMVRDLHLVQAMRPTTQWDYYEVSETIPLLSHLFPRPSGFLTQ